MKWRLSKRGLASINKGSIGSVHCVTGGGGGGGGGGCGGGGGSSGGGDTPSASNSSIIQHSINKLNITIE